jgi:hypothetical protein
MGKRTASRQQRITNSQANGRPVVKPPVPSAAPAPPNPYDPKRLRVAADMGAARGVKKALTTVKVKKPEKSWWVRTHPDVDNYWLTTRVITLSDKRETYLVAPELHAELVAEPTCTTQLLITSINRQGDVFLWPIRPSTGTGRADDWNRSAKDAADMAAASWVRVAANMTLGAYDVFLATNVLDDPEWPDKSLEDLLRIAFRDFTIDTLDHPVLVALRKGV